MRCECQDVASDIKVLLSHSSDSSVRFGQHFWSLVADHGLALPAIAAHQPLTIGLNRRDQHNRLEDEIKASIENAKRLKISEAFLLDEYGSVSLVGLDACEGDRECTARINTGDVRLLARANCIHKACELSRIRIAEQLDVAAHGLL
jgi:hypothetical protein